jgi:hypothetical protein
MNLVRSRPSTASRTATDDADSVRAPDVILASGNVVIAPMLQPQ